MPISAPSTARLSERAPASRRSRRRPGDFGDAEILREARRRFTAFLAQPASLRPGLRATVVRLAGRGADPATYESLLAYARRTLNTAERQDAYHALASARDARLAER